MHRTLRVHWGVARTHLEEKELGVIVVLRVELIALAEPIAFKQRVDVDITRSLKAELSVDSFDSLLEFVVHLEDEAVYLASERGRQPTLGQKGEKRQVALLQPVVTSLNKRA